MIGSALFSATCPPSPSASATRSVKRPAAARDVGDAGREHALLAGQLLVDRVGDAVRGEAQVGRLHRVALRDQLAALDRVPELEAHVEAAIGEPGRRARGERIAAAAAPFAQFGELVSSSAPPPSTMRNTPLRSRSARTIDEIAWPARSSSRNLTIEIGSWVAPTPEISTRNWAHAGTRARRRRRR
jgi:hypothetical protein